MAKEKTDLLQGTLDMLILKVLQRGPIHGFGIAMEIGRISQSMLQVEQGSLYPALYRLEEQELISAEWGMSDNNRKARYYRLTPAGRKQLTAATNRWAQLVRAIERVLKPVQEPVEE